MANGQWTKWLNVVSAGLVVVAVPASVAYAVNVSGKLGLIQSQITEVKTQMESQSKILTDTRVDVRAMQLLMGKGD